MDNLYEPPLKDCSQSHDFPSHLVVFCGGLIAGIIVASALQIEFWVALLFVVLPIIVGMAIVVCDYRKAKTFDERFPPIDDKEFLRRCRPGVNPEIALRVRRIVATQLGIEYEQIHPDQSFVRDLDC